MKKWVFERVFGALAITIAVFAVLPTAAFAAPVVPAGFEIQTIVSGLNLPTTLAFAPDGRIFTAQKSGAVRIVKNGALLATPFIQLTDLNDYSDHGLLGIALDPNFNSNNYVYLLYTYENDPANYTGSKTGRIVRITATGDVAATSSMSTLLGSVGGTPALPSCVNYATTSDCIPSDSPSHSVGGLRFGPDGKLYAALGDGAHYDYMDVRALRAQDLDSLGGKIIRINPDGTAPANNPFYNGNPNANRSKVWNYGVRNDFRFNFRPSNGTLYLGDVGWYSYEEINIGLPGRNFGWPCREGYLAAPAYNCTPSSTATDPMYAYGHDPVTGAGAVVAGVFASNVYPAPYAGSYFFGDFAMNFIKRMDVDANDNFIAVNEFMTGAGGPVEIVNGPDGYMYYLSIYTGQLRRIFYTTGNRAPIASASANPTSGLLPLVVNFSSAGTNDLDNDTLSYAWNFGDGSATSTAPNPQHTYSVAGPYTATLTVSDGHGGTDKKTISLYAGDRAPTATIAVPIGGPFYEPNQTVTLSATASDPEDGALPDANFSWQVILHHNTHIHILQALSGMNPSFIGPDHDANDNVWLEVILTVHDSVGVTDSKTINLYRHVTNPHLVQIRTAPETNIVPFQHTQITATITNSGSTGPVLVDIEVFKNDVKIAQGFWDNQVIQTGENQQFTYDWVPQSTGAYRIAVGLIHPSWGDIFNWTNDAIDVAVTEGTTTPLTVFTPEHRSTTASTVTPVINQPLHLSTTVQNAGIAGSALIDIEIFKDNAKIGQQFYDNEPFSAGETRSFPFDWTPTSSGDYRVAVGLIQPGWTGLYQWTNSVLITHIYDTIPPPDTLKGLQFDGIDDHVDTAVWNIEENQGFTLEAFFRADTVSHEVKLLSKGHGAADTAHAWSLGYDALGNLKFVLTTNGVTTALTGGSVAPGEMVKVAAVYDGAHMTLYKNGVNIGTIAKTGAIATPSDVVWVGDDPSTPGTAPFQGFLDEMHVFNIPRSEAEINSTLTPGSLAGNTIGLIKYWKADEGFGQDMIDYSNSGHHGVLGSTPDADSNDPTWSPARIIPAGAVFTPIHVSTVASPNPINVGIPMTLTTTVQDTGQSPGYLVIDVEIYNASGTQVAQHFFDGVGLDPNQTRSFNFDWMPTATGTYRVAVGLVKLHWSGLYQWVNDAADAVVGATPPPPAGTPIYSDALSTGWGSWSWDTTENFASTEAVADGTQAIKVTFNAPWAGFYLHNDGVDTTGKTNLVFKINGGAVGGQELQIRFFDSIGTPMMQKRIAPYLTGGIAANTWKTVMIPLPDLDGANKIITAVVVQGASGNIEAPFFIDSISLQ